MGTQASPVMAKRQSKGRSQSGTALANALRTDAEKTLKFPENVESIDHWCAIRIFQRKLFRRHDTPLQNDYLRIFLPMPINLATGYNHGYNAESLGPVGALGGAVGAVAGSEVRNAIAGGGDLKSIFDGLKQGTDGKGVVAGIVSKLTEGIEAAPILGQGVKGALGGAGIARNPFQALLYESPALREHTFSWKLVAKNYTESISIYDITKALKFHAAPGRFSAGGEINTQSVFLEYPDQFDVDFHYDDFLYNMAPSVLKSISVNYHPDGPMYHTSQYGKKAPVAVQLDLSFQEVSIVTREDINDRDR